MTEKQYDWLVKELSPHSPAWKDCLWAFCIGGGISKEGDTLIVPLTELVNREVYSRFSKRQTKIAAAKLGNDAGIIGAAALGLQFLKEEA